jgi:hypothetical protein
MAFDRLAEELTEVFKTAPHPGKGVPLPDDLFTDPKDPAVKQVAVDAVKQAGTEERKKFVTLFIYNLFGELHAADLLSQKFTAKNNDYTEIGTAADLASEPYVSADGRDVLDVDPRAMYAFDSKGRFLTVYPDGRPGISTLRPGKIKGGGRFEKDKFQSANLDKENYAGNVRFFQSALNGQPVTPKVLGWSGSEGTTIPTDRGSEAAKIVDDVAAIAILKACSDMVFSMEGTAKSAGDYKKVSPLDTGETTTMGRWFGYSRPYKFTLTAPLKIDGLTDTDKSVIKDAVQGANRFIGGAADYGSGSFQLTFTKVVDIKIGMRAGRFDTETMGSLD